MGKPYKSEIDNLVSTYEWSMGCEIKKLAAVIHRIGLHSLISVGSGGSFTVASFHAQLHEKATGKPSYAITPYQTTTHTKVLANSAVSLFSAEGKNKDILGALNVVIEAEPQEALVFTLKKDVPILERASQSNWVSTVSFEMPWGKDGYLATNSLFAFCIILYRAYQKAYPQTFTALPLLLDKLIQESIVDFNNELNRYADSICVPHDYLLVVFGESGRIASIDIESKMAESALAHALIADFRNFAHGRHLWADRHRSAAATLVIWAEEDRSLYENYIATLPSSIPRISMHLTGPDGWQVLSSIWGVLKLVETLGQLKCIDPGQPEVADFGREFYKIDAFKTASKTNTVATPELAALRKYKSFERFSVETKQFLIAGYQQFLVALSAADFSYLVLDYDATLCSPDNRYTGMSEEIYAPIIHLLEQGLTLGIATGRGASVSKDFKDVIPKHLWHRIWIGLYNCGVVLPLTETYKPEDQPKDKDLLLLYESLSKNKYILSMFELEPRPTQLTMTALDSTSCDMAWRVISEILASPQYSQLKAVRSTHSWDVINKSTSKVNLVSHLEKNGEKSLCMGDRGLWPGNDYELLNTAYSLGVDEISPLNPNCWNIAPLGIKGVAATAFYLSCIQMSFDKFNFKVREMT
jgi:hydroxymethylpyrimidine pyrophosphatase-like HAD family hydrolase